MKKNNKIGVKKIIKKRIEVNLVKSAEMNMRNKLRRSGIPDKSPRVSTHERRRIRNGISPENNYNEDSFKIILDKLRKNETFSFLRFGDADYLMMFEENIGNTVGASNKFLVTEKLLFELKEAHSINDKNYCIGSVLKTNNHKNKLYSYVSFVRKNMNKIYTTGINLNNLFSAVSLTEIYFTNINLFYELIKELKQSKTMFIGSYYHDNLDLVYGEIIYNIKTKPTNCYDEVDDILNEIIENIDDVDKIIFSCGQTARVLIKRLWKLGINKTMLDFGSLSDYFVLNTDLSDQIQLRGHIVKNKEIIKENYKKLIKIMEEDLSMFGGWAIDVECYKKILEILPAGKTILEFGSGHATNKLAETYKMYSVEHDVNWVGKYNSTYIHAPIKIETSEDPAINWYSVEAIKNNLPENYDLILVDGPVGALTPNGMTRDGFRRHIELFNLDNTIIVFDDIQRSGEMTSMLKLVKQLNRKYEIFDSGANQKNKKKFGVIYP